MIQCPRGRHSGAPRGSGKTVSDLARLADSRFSAAINLPQQGTPAGL